MLGKNVFDVTDDVSLGYAAKNSKCGDTVNCMTPELMAKFYDIRKNKGQTVSLDEELMK